MTDRSNPMTDSERAEMYRAALVDAHAEIDRLRADNARLHKPAYLTIRKPSWWPKAKDRTR